MPRWFGNEWAAEIALTAANLQWWQTHAPEGFTPSPDRLFENRSLGLCSTSMYEHFGDPVRATLTGGVSRTRLGWPVLCLEGAIWHDAGDRHRIVQGMLQWRGNSLPMRLLWGGLLFDVIFFGICIWTIDWFCARARSVIRLGRGQCPACRYLIGESPVCTECGHPLPEKTAARRPGEAFADWMFAHHRRFALVCLMLLAMVVNVAVAVALAAAMDPWRESVHVKSPTLERDLEWFRRHSPSPDQPSSVYESASVGTMRKAGVISDHPGGAEIYRSGWPMYSLQGVDWAGMSARVCTRGPVFSSGNVLFIIRDTFRSQGALRQREMAIPLQPMWPGFVVNTVFFALVLIGLRQFRLWLRHWPTPGR